jgi:amino acid transporter
MSQFPDQIQAGQPAAGTDGAPAKLPGTSPPEPEVTRPPLGLWDAVSIIVGIVVGVGIYQTAPFILKNTDGAITALVAWGVAGALSLAGALCYAELATTYPRTGGDYVYLGRAFGRWMGFLFGWAQLTVILTGSIGMMAFVFSDYALRFVKVAFDQELGTVASFAFAGGAVLVLTLTNVLGVVFGKVTQNVLSTAKVIGLGAIIVAGFAFPHAEAWTQPGLSVDELKKLTFPFFTPVLGVAMVLILYTYGGWNDSAFVAAEVRDGKRNITRALVLGLLIVTALYLLVNAAYINSLGFPDAQRSNQIAADVLGKAFGDAGASLMCVLVMVSALGAVNGLIFTGARVYSTVGRDHPVLSWMAGWNRESGTPVPALITQGAITLALIFLVGTTWGRDAINHLLDGKFLGREPGSVPVGWGKGVDTVWNAIGLKAVSWEGAGGFDTLLTCTAPIFWLFFLLTGLSLFILRERDKHLERPFKVPFYPELPLLFCATCVYMLYSSTDYALSRGWKGGLILLGFVPLVIGLVLYRIGAALSPAGRRSEEPSPFDERTVANVPR